MNASMGVVLIQSHVSYSSFDYLRTKKMPTFNASAMDVVMVEAEEAREFEAGCKRAAAKGAALISVFFVLRVMFSLVTGIELSMATSVASAGVGLFIVGIMLMAGRTTSEPVCLRE